MFKWVKGFNKRDINKVLIVKEKIRTQTNGFKLDNFRFRKDIGTNWFTNCVVEEWDKLSKQVVRAGTVDTLKKRLDISMDEENKWLVLGAQGLPSVSKVASCSLLIFLCSYVHNTLLPLPSSSTVLPGFSAALAWQAVMMHGHDASLGCIRSCVSSITATTAIIITQIDNNSGNTRTAAPVWRADGHSLSLDSWLIQCSFSILSWRHYQVPSHSHQQHLAHNKLTNTC